jgi:hypothetical protein
MRGERVHSPTPFSVGASRLACAIVFASACACVAQESQPAATQTDRPATAVQAPTAASDDSKQQTTNPSKLTKQQKAAAADIERKKQIADESTQLLSMALALKAEVDKTTKDTLSINVIRKADEIEKLARTVKEKMKQSSGAS